MVKIQIEKKKVKCIICGRAVSKYTARISNPKDNPYEDRDLDLRPGKPYRNTMRYWINQCPHCGYTAVRPEKGVNIPEIKRIMNSPEYKNCEGVKYRSPLAEKFHKGYMLTFSVFGKLRMMHYASWACDDAGDVLNANLCRLQVIAKADRMLTFTDKQLKENGITRESLIILKADLYRRIRCFRASEKTIKNERFDGVMEEFRLFEEEKIKEKDSLRYKIGDAVNNPPLNK